MAWNFSISPDSFFLGVIFMAFLMLLIWLIPKLQFKKKEKLEVV